MGDDEEKPDDEGGAADGAEEDEADGDSDDDADVGLTKVVTPAEFQKRRRLRPESRGLSSEEMMHWSRPRRWDVRIWNVAVENCTAEEMKVFVNFVFGGTSEDYLVKVGLRKEIWVAGEPGVNIRTPVLIDKPGDDESTEVPLDVKFEWRGSYLDLENQTLRIEVWNWARARVNKFDSKSEQPLLQYAKGYISNEARCVKTDKFGGEKLRMKISFKLYFQEIYDFELNFLKFRAMGLPTCANAVELLGKVAQNSDHRITVRKGMEFADRETRITIIGNEADADKRLRIVTPQNTKHWTSARQRATKWLSGLSPDWGEVMTGVQFRGTVSDLHRASMQLIVYTKENAKAVGFGGRGCLCCKRKAVPLCTATVSMKGKLHNGGVNTIMKPASWLYRMPGGSKAHRLECGQVEGQVKIINKPRFTQLDDMGDELEPNCRYLIVKVLKVDNVVTPDARALDEIDTFVQVTWGTQTKRTRLVQDDITPIYNDELIFKLNLGSSMSDENGKLSLSDNKQTWEELEQLGPVYFDLWSEGTINLEHLGRCYAHLCEIVEDERGQSRAHAMKEALSSASATGKLAYSVRSCKLTKRLNYVWGMGQPSNLSFEMYFMPDLSDVAKLRPITPSEIAVKNIQLRIDAWNKAIHDRNTESIDADEADNRAFPCTMQCQWGEKFGDIFLPRYLDAIEPPSGVDTCTRVMHYIGCIPYAPKKLTRPHAKTPDFFLMMRKGDALDHALLHASFLLGLGKDAYVCLGTTLNKESHAWVVTFEQDASLVFWEPFLGTGSYALHNRFAHPEYVLPGGPIKRLSSEGLEQERLRRRRLALAWKSMRTSMRRTTARMVFVDVRLGDSKTGDHAVHALDLPPGEHHAHPMTYANRTTFVTASVTCGKCKRSGGNPVYVRGFHCATCSFDLCYECAELCWKDKDALRAIEFDATEAVDFSVPRGLRSEPILPYRTVDAIFNNKNSWANLQNPDPSRIFWDLWNGDYWHAFAPRIKGVSPCFQQVDYKVSNRGDKQWLDDTKAEIARACQQAIRTKRSRLSLATRWVRNEALTNFLEKGLELLYELETCDVDSRDALTDKLDGWKELLEGKTPPEHTTRFLPIHFNFFDAEPLAEAVIQHCSFIESREKMSQFAMAVHIVTLPGEVVSVYISICQVVKEDATSTPLVPKPLGRVCRDPTVEATHALRALRRAQKRVAEAKEKAVQGLAYSDLDGESSEGEKEDDEELIDEVFVPPAPPPEEEMPALLPTEPQSCSRSSLETPPAMPPETPPETPMKVPSETPTDIVREVPLVKPVERHKVPLSPMSCFASTSSAIELSERGRVASYIGKKTEGHSDMFGVLIGDGYLEAGKEGKYFEVELRHAIVGQPDSLAIGVTTVRPDDLRDGEPPMTAADVESTWCAGFDGAFWDGETEAFVDIEGWSPQDLAKGDRFGFLVEPNGSAVVFLNSHVIFVWEDGVPYDEPLFAIIDLLGNAQEVSLIVDARPPSPEEAAKKPLMQGFHKSIAGKNVDISIDGQVATFCNSHADDMYDGIVLGDGPLMEAPGERVYFEIAMVRHRLGQHDGVAIGVTAGEPNAERRLPSTLDALVPVWAAGFDGTMFDSASQKWTRIEWRPQELRTGDRVGCLVTSGGEMFIYVNGACVAPGPKGIYQKAGKPLYAVFNLIGAAEGIKFLADAMAPGTDPKVVAAPPTPKPASLPPMSGFCRKRIGTNVQLSNGDRSAEHNGTTGEERHGGLLSNGPMKKYSSGWYFEAQVDKVRSEKEDGMAIGVTISGPDDFEEMPDTMDELDMAWLVGFDGAEWNGSQLNWAPALWKPAQLRTGDRVGALVMLNGELRVFVNGTGVQRCAFHIPVDKCLFGVVDLVGATAAVTLLPDAEPPTNTSLAKVFRRPKVKLPEDPFDVDPAQLPVPDGAAEMRTLCSEKKGRFVKLSADCLTAAYVGADGELEGGVIGDGPLPVTHEGVYFELRIDKVATGSPDGLAIGVTNTAPEQLPRLLPETMDCVNASWLVGFDGAMWDGSSRNFSDLAWYPKDLKVGDRVGILVEAETGDMSVYVNGKWRIKGPRQIHCNKPLFAIIDVIGNTRAITLLPNARFPIKSSDSSVVAVAQAVAKTDGFSTSALGKHVSLSVDGRSAVRSQQVDPSLLNGVVFGSAPIGSFGGARYFEVSVDTVLSEAQHDGLAIGVTTRFPDEMLNVPHTADQVESTWLVGFDGATWDGATSQWGFCPWNSCSLKVGDVVGIYVDAHGALSVFVNGQCEAQNAIPPGSIPVDDEQRLFAVVDLIGVVCGVSLKANISPPPLPKPASPTPAGGSSSGHQATPMRGFDKTMHGSAVTLSQNAKSAVRPRGMPVLHGVLVGDGPLEATKSGGIEFAIAVTEVEAGGMDGLAVGFTTKPPWEWKECPESADQIDRAWLVGFDGACWDGSAMKWGFSDWDPSKLSVGDILIVRATPNLELVVLVNGSVCAHHAMHIPFQAPLFALVDLVGNTVGVSLNVSASAYDSGGQTLKPISGGALKKKEKSTVSPAPKAEPGGLRGFDAASAGQSVCVKGSIASYTQRVPNHGVAFSDGFLALHTGGGHCYSLLVLKLQKGMEDGFAIGVTSTAPSSLREAPQNADLVFPSWLVGFDGAAWNGARKEWSVSEFHGKDLKVGDVLTLLVTRLGELHVHVNGMRSAAHNMRIPRQTHLYALVDLSGLVGEVAIANSEALLPKQPRRAASSVAANEKAYDLGSSRDSRNTLLSGFCRSPIGSALTLQADGIQVRRLLGSGQASDIGDGVLVSNGVLLHEEGTGIAYYSLSILALEAKLPDDCFAVGVTTRCPKTFPARLPPSAEQVSPSWLVGFDGAYWDGHMAEWSLSDFGGRDLHEGDVLTIAVVANKLHSAAELRIQVNDRVVASHAMCGYSANDPLYALVDLAGHVVGACLVLKGAGPSMKKISQRPTSADSDLAARQQVQEGAGADRKSGGKAASMPKAHGRKPSKPLPLKLAAKGKDQVLRSADGKSVRFPLAKE